VSTISVAPDIDNESRAELLSDGCCVFKDVLDQAMLRELTRVTNKLLDAAPQEELDHVRYQGSNIFIAYQDPAFARLIAWPRALTLLKNLGFNDPKWLSAFLLSKPPLAPPLYWHQDWAYWGAPCSALESPPQLFLMYYLTDTTRQNGCLRIIPGTHRRRIALHDQLPAAHSQEAYTASLDSPAFCQHPVERDVPVFAGDLVIGDARVLHAAHANQTLQRRTCLTLWYAPDYRSLAAPLRACLARGRPMEAPHWWPDAEGDLVAPLIPAYEGDATPAAWDRIPALHLK